MPRVRAVASSARSIYIAHTKKLTVALFARAIKAADAAILLAQAGLTEDAKGIARTVFELLQHVAFINVEQEKRALRTKMYLLEGVIDQIEDAELRRRWHEEIGIRIARDKSLCQTRRMTLDELESQNKRWRFLPANEKLTLLRELWAKLEPKPTSEGTIRTFDHLVRIIGNRHVHVRPQSLKSVITSQRGFGERCEFSVTYKPSMDGALPVLKEVRILMLAFSQTMALMFYHRSDRLPVQIARALDSPKTPVNSDTLKMVGKAEAQKDYSRQVRAIERRYQQIAAMRA